MLEIDLSRQASKFLEKSHPKHVKQIARKLLELQQNPFPQDSIKLKGKYSDFHRTDIGEYRIIYFIKEKTIYVIIIGKRNDGHVYKILVR